MSQFEHCVRGPVSHAGKLAGVPDGDTRPSFVLEHRQQFTFKPYQGRVVFSLVPSAAGAIALAVGGTTAVMPKYAGVSGLSTPTAPSFTIPPGAYNNHILSYNPPPTSVGSKPYGPYSTTGYRYITQVAEVNYTGSTMMDNGSVTVGRYALDPSVTDDTYNTQGTDLQVMATQFLPNSAAELSIKPDTQTFPAKKNFVIRNVPTDYEYQPIYLNTVYQSGTVLTNCLFGLDSTNALAPMPNAGFATNVPVTVCVYDGLDDTATITISLRSCVEYMISVNSVMAPVSGPSPKAEPGILTRIANWARQIPVAEMLENMYSGYGVLTKIFQALPILSRGGRPGLPMLTNH